MSNSLECSTNRERPFIDEIMLRGSVFSRIYKSRNSEKACNLQSGLSDVLLLFPFLDLTSEFYLSRQRIGGREPRFPRVSFGRVMLSFPVRHNVALNGA